MRLFTSKTPKFTAPVVALVPPTLTERFNEASGLAAYALDSFTSAARDLEVAAELHDEVAAEASAKVIDLFTVKAEAELAGMEARTVASKIYNLVAA